MNKQIIRALFAGFLAGVALLSVYFLIVSLANSVEHAIQEFLRIWQWISALVVGFGLQVGLYIYIREAIKIRKLSGATTSVAAAGGVSTTSMVACCAHHLTDVLPIIGLSAASIFLNKYQESFLLIGVLSNMIGTIIMLRIMQTSLLYDEQKGILRTIFKVNLRKVLYFAIPASLIMIAISFIKTL
jgi:hypothetical protein